MDRSDVCVLLPTLDEAETIADVVEGFREAGFERILVMDGGSTDGTVEAATEAGARVERQTGSGKGQAVREAVERHVAAEYVLLADGDGTYRPSDAATMLDPLEEGYEHVIGDRFADMREGAMTSLNRIGNRLINRAFALVHGEPFGDILSGYRAFTRESFQRMTLTADGFGIETEMAVECARRNIRTTTVPITYLPRPAGSNTNLHPVRDGGIIFLELYRRAKTSNPLFYFGSVGALSTIAGVGIGAYVGIEWVTANTSHEVMAVVSAFGIIFGVQLLMFGVLSDLILTLHRETVERIRGVERDVEPGGASVARQAHRAPTSADRDGDETTARAATDSDASAGASGDDSRDGADAGRVNGSGSDDDQAEADPSSPSTARSSRQGPTGPPNED
jgi:dolichol-phosphate mannosyltransferase